MRLDISLKSKWSAFTTSVNYAILELLVIDKCKLHIF